VLAERRIPQRLEPLQHRLLDHTVDHGWHTPSELHSTPIGLWDLLKSFIRSIRCAASGSSF
jgi:hypothetical protein